jgi:hypothetical protein
VIFESVEMGRPELAIGGEPFIEVFERFRSNAVQAALRIRARLDEPRVLENAEVLGHSRLAEADAVDEFADRPLAVAEQIEDLKPPRLGQDLERREGTHPLSITVWLYACQGIKDQCDNEPARVLRS